MRRDGETASTETADGSALDELRNARPGVDPVDRADVRARAERALFGTGTPANVGRFVLLGPLAGGGMGMVYTAYDPQLDRKVALKVLHPERRHGSKARERLLAEARVLARLDHPNVVPVHDVTIVDDQVVLVMELVAGPTLAAWEREHPRTWRDVVAVYGAAGRGLAAAHRLELVHRDFKPANAIVGDDGRVRVLDFGLARFTTMAAASDADPPATAGPFTTEGALVGTLAYMAPEVLAGETATAASDQFSFCVALYRSLFRTPPFTGATVDELLVAIRRERPTRPDVSGVPGWLRAVVTRGLAVAPGARHPTMEALLGQLERERGWRRWRVPLAVGVVAAVTMTAAAVIGLDDDPLAACDGGLAEIDSAWNAGSRAGLERAFASVAAPFARDAHLRTVAALDDYRARWSQGHRDACVAHRKGSDSSNLFDRRMSCLRRRRDALAAAVTALSSVDADSITYALDVTARLPRLDDCADADLLLADAPPPTTAQARAEVASIRATLQQAEAFERAGHSASALALATSLLQRAEAVAYPPVLVDVLLVQGRILLQRNEMLDAAAPLRRAEELALAHGLLSAAVVAGARRIFVEARSTDDTAVFASLVGHGTVLEPLSCNLLHDPFACPLLLNNLGVLANIAGDRDLARRRFDEARAVLSTVASPDIELTMIDLNVAMLTADAAERVALTRAVFERRRAILGPHHVLTLEAQGSLAYRTTDLGLAREMLEEVVASLGTYHPRLVGDRADREHYLAFLLAESGDHVGAAARYAEAASIDPRDETRARTWTRLSSGYAALYRRDHATAMAAFEAVVAEQGGATEWWLREYRANGHLGAGLAEAARGDRIAAIAHLQHAISDFELVIPRTPSVASRLRLARARTALSSVRNVIDGSRLP